MASRSGYAEATASLTRARLNSITANGSQTALRAPIRAAVDDRAGPADVGLAGLQPLDRRDQHELARDLEVRELGPAVPCELVELGTGTGPGLHDRHHPLAPAVVGDAEHDRVEHVGVGLEHGLDLVGRHLLATAVDRAGTPTEQVHRAVGLDGGEVAGDRPAHAVDHPEGAGGRLVVAVVPDGNRTAVRDHADLPGARWHRLALVVEHLG